MQTSFKTLWKKTLKVRNISSTASEKTINLLFEGALKCKDRMETPLKCTCLKENHSSYCYYCNKILCPNCVRLCDLCKEDFCSNCSLFMHDLNRDTVCLSCLNDI
ncbi:hypothetical protein WA026_004693 [Henosepilachna vigintioctopunctata]|uniref:Apoptosis regulatory protein Siva n=1 Tax=Henosepilachna vigintioctopunctata TaxID=420089 RepID=A0AAW1V149_9CUCU